MAAMGKGPEVYRVHISAGLSKSMQRTQCFRAQAASGEETGGILLGSDRAGVRPTHSRRILLAGSLEDLGPLQAGDPRDRGDHHAGEQLHRGHIPFVKSAWG